MGSLPAPNFKIISIYRYSYSSFLSLSLIFESKSHIKLTRLFEKLVIVAFDFTDRFQPTDFTHSLNSITHRKKIINILNSPLFLYHISGEGREKFKEYTAFINFTLPYQD